MSHDWSMAPRRHLSTWDRPHFFSRLSCEVLLELSKRRRPDASPRGDWPDLLLVPPRFMFGGLAGAPGEPSLRTESPAARPFEFEGALSARSVVPGEAVVAVAVSLDESAPPSTEDSSWRSWRSWGSSL